MIYTFHSLFYKNRSPQLVIVIIAFMSDLELSTYYLKTNYELVSKCL